MKAKLVIVMLVVLAIVSIVVVKLNKKELKPNDLSSNANTISVSSSMSDEVIEYKGVVIENISLDEEEKALYFVISSKKEENISLSVVLLNTKREDSANRKTMVLTNLKEEKNVKIELENIYNDPEKIKFLIGE